MAERRPNPMHLVAWAIAGASLAASVWFLSFLPIPRLYASGCGFWPILWANRLRLIAFLGPFVCGVLIWWRAEKRFKRGLMDDVWTEGELAPVRSLLSSRIWKWIVWPMYAVCMVSLIIWGKHGLHGAFVYIVTFPPQTVFRLRQAVTPSVINRSGFLDMRDCKPIHSDHWGEPRRDEGGLLSSRLD